MKKPKPNPAPRKEEHVVAVRLNEAQSAAMASVTEHCAKLTGDAEFTPERVLKILLDREVMLMKLGRVNAIPPPVATSAVALNGVAGPPLPLGGIDIPAVILDGKAWVSLLRLCKMLGVRAHG